MFIPPQFLETPSFIHEPGKCQPFHSELRTSLSGRTLVLRAFVNVCVSSFRPLFVLSYNLGSGVASIMVNGSFSDGRWHRVKAVRWAPARWETEPGYKRVDVHSAFFLSCCPLTQLYVASSYCYQYSPMSPTDTNGQKLNPSIYSKWKERTWRKQIVLCGYLLNTALYYIWTFSYVHPCHTSISSTPFHQPSLWSLGQRKSHVWHGISTSRSYVHMWFSLPTNKETTIEKRHGVCLLETRLIWLIW